MSRRPAHRHAANHRGSSRLALRASVALNVVLAGTLLFLLARPAAESPASLPDPLPVARAAAAAASHGSDAAPAAALEPPRAAGGESGVTPAAMAQLRQMGLPPALLAEVVLQNFNRQWDARSAELERRYAPKPVPEREYRELNRLRDAEQARELAEALGEAGYHAWDKERTLDNLNVGDIELTAEEAERAYRLQKEFDDKHRELQIAMEDGVADPADAAALQELARTAFERETEKLLGKERYDRMRGVTTPVADAAFRFAALNPTAEQASAAAQVEHNYREQEAMLTRRLGLNAGDPTALTAELRTISEARDNELRRLIGAENFDALQRQNDPTYQTLQQYAGAWELREHEVGSVYDSLRVFQTEAERMRNAAALAEAAGQRVNWSEVDAAIEQSRLQTESGLQRLIGPDRLRRLRQNGLLAPR